MLLFVFYVIYLLKVSKRSEVSICSSYPCDTSLHSAHTLGGDIPNMVISGTEAPPSSQSFEGQPIRLKLTETARFRLGHAKLHLTLVCRFSLRSSGAGFNLFLRLKLEVKGHSQLQPSMLYLRKSGQLSQ